jgi:dienelactone hydrolase
VQSNYEPKGFFKPYAGFQKVYVTGPEKPGRLAIVCVYDIFGFKPQTQQGADIIAESLKAQVVMPDFIEGDEPWPLDKFPPKTDEDKKKLQEWFGGFANPANHIPKLIEVGKALKEEGAEFVAVYGFCWGGKIVIKAGGEPDSPFDAVSIVHPAMLSVEDAEKLNVPLGLFISKDEPEDEYHKIVEVISKKPFADKNSYKIFESFHGFAAARANLDEPDNKDKYGHLYKKLTHFLKNASGQEHSA